MTPVQPSLAPTQLSQQQQFLNGIATRLSQLAANPPDLGVYLRAHAECVTGAFRPVGFAYEIKVGTVFQRVLHSNLESLGFRDSPEQEDSFVRARNMAADQRKTLLIPPQTRPTTGLQGPSPVESPAPDELATFNHTPYEQLFVPILFGEGTAGILHVWFPPSNNAASHARLTVLRQLCVEFEHYLKARRARDASDEVARLTTYTRLLDELTGDIDLDSVSWKLVNYAREAVACERVCLFIARDYGRAMAAHAVAGELEYEFQLQACSGLKRPHPKSEQAVILQHAARKLTEMSLEKTTNDSPAPAVNNPGAANEALASPTGTGERQVAANPHSIFGDAGRPKTQLTLLMRDPSKEATRPPEVNEYFDVMPMNWATVIPLFDREQRVCGIILFEGVKLEEKLSNSLKPMIELAASAGKALGTTLYCSQNRSMRLAKRLVALRQEYVNTPAKRLWLRFGFPVLLVAAVLAFPFPYKVKGNANVLPVKQSTLPALVGSRLLEVNVREGEAVKKDQVLARFDTTDIRLQLAQAQHEYDSAQVASGAALAAGNETQMQISRLTGERALATAQKLQMDLQRAVVRAPFDGLVLGAQTLSMRVGEVLRVGETALQVVDPTAWQVKTNLKERDLILLDRELRQEGPVPGILRLAANPAHKYPVELTNKDQLAYGLDTSTNQYLFTAMLPLNSRIDNPTFLKAGFTGQVSFGAGIHSLAYSLFKDFADYLTVRFF